jgi:4-hydroxybenzoyl-CoA thioesterase
MPPFVLRLPVRFSDVDHAGIVYFPRFFHFFHLALEELFHDRLGPRGYVRLLDEDKIGFPSVSARCDFRSPLRFGDVMEVELEVARLGEKSVTFGFRIFRLVDGDARGGAAPVSEGAAPPLTRVLAAEGESVSAIVDLTRFRAVAVPDGLRGILTSIARDGAAAPGS